MTQTPIGDNRVVAFNAHTGQLTLLDADHRRVLEQIRIGVPVADEAVLRDLLVRRFVFDSLGDEERSFQEMCRASLAAFETGAPRHYTFIVNTLCNFACPYCFEPEDSRRSHARLSGAQVDAAFQVIDDAATGPANAGAGPDVEVFGGEPLLPGSRPIVEQICESVRERHGVVSLQTNGYHLAENLDLLRTFDGTLTGVQVTIDGPRGIHDRRRVLRSGRGTFDRIVAAVDALAASDLSIHVSVRINVDAENLPYLPEMAQLYAEHGWSQDERFRFVAAPVDDRSCTLDAQRALVGWRELLEHVLPLSTDAGAGPFDLAVFKPIGWLRRFLAGVRNGDDLSSTFVPRANYCEATALKLFVFHPDGQIYPCPETVGNPTLAIGHYHPSFHIDPARAAPWLASSVLARASCTACPISTLCGGGCTLAAIRRHGGTATPECEEAPELVADYLSRLAPVQS
jgi:uncharacterized protein